MKNTIKSYKGKLSDFLQHIKNTKSTMQNEKEKLPSKARMKAGLLLPKLAQIILENGKAKISPKAERALERVASVEASEPFGSVLATYEQLMAEVKAQIGPMRFFKATCAAFRYHAGVVGYSTIVMRNLMPFISEQATFSIPADVNLVYACEPKDITVYDDGTAEIEI
jgi:hypothetical protein